MGYFEKGKEVAVIVEHRHTEMSEDRINEELALLKPNLEFLSGTRGQEVGRQVAYATFELESRANAAEMQENGVDSTTSWPKTAQIVEQYAPIVESLEDVELETFLASEAEMS